MDKKYILIVDDDEGILKSFAAILEFKGYNVSTARSGQEAIEKFRVNFYNLALVDIKLPDMEGTELLREFHEINPEMMKVIVTGYATLQNAVESLNLGANGYLIKPVTAGKLRSIVADKLTEQEAKIRQNEDTVNNLLKAKMQHEQNLDRWA